MLTNQPNGVNMELTESVARKVLTTVDAGLVSGMGSPVAGQMCVEAAVCFALGLPHGDNPPCVGRSVRNYKIRLNDSRWSSDAARSKGMRRVAIAQLGSNLIDQRQFADYVVVQGIKRILPIALRALAGREKDETRKADVLAAVAACEACTDTPSARLAADHARRAARYVYGSCWADADADADAAASAAASAADAAASDAASAAASAADAAAARDTTLSLAAEITVEALQAQNCQGTQWLWLCDEKLAA